MVDRRTVATIGTLGFAALAVARALTTSSDPGPPPAPASAPAPDGQRIDPRLIPCAPMRLVVDQVDGRKAAVVVRATLRLSDGVPFPHQPLRFRVLEAADEPFLWTASATTGADGRAEVALGAQARRRPDARAALDRGRVLEVEFDNPADRGVMPPPGLCDATVRATFAPR